MGLRPTQRDENQARRHPRESGGPWLVSNPMDSRSPPSRGQASRE